MIFRASSRFPEDPSGRHNEDWAHFQRVENGEGVLLDARGPGVITRFWATQRSRTAAPAVEEDFQIRIEIDGREVLASGLRELTSGSVTGFPRPWVAGPDSASGSLLVAVPIHFQDSIRVTAEIREGFETFEPTLGATSNGDLYFSTTPDAGVAIGWRASIARSIDRGRSWRDVGPTLASFSNPPETNDPYVYVDPATNRIFTMHMSPILTCSPETWPYPSRTRWPGTRASSASP